MHVVVCRNILVITIYTFQLSFINTLTVVFQLKLNIQLNVCSIFSCYIESYTKHSTILIYIN
jgi:hypothetical protein